jgi:hypothetical protein
MRYLRERGWTDLVRVCADRCDLDDRSPIASTIAAPTNLTIVADVPGLAFIVIVFQMSACFD